MAVDATIALGAGTALALGAALVVLGPLWNGAPESGRTAHGAGPHVPDEGNAQRDGVSAVEALREIEFDRATGKLSDEDYAALKTEYTRDAVAELRAAQGRTAAAASAAAADPVEDALRAYRARQSSPWAGARSCVAHGPRPESEAAFCSECGRYLAGSCPQCGASCDHEGQRFCERCGAGLAALGSAAAVAAGG